MSDLDDEIDGNFEGFYADWSAQAQANWTALHPEDALKRSYRRLSAFQTLKQQIVVPSSSEAAASIFHEAHNDALTSHTLASIGAWRASLKSLRSLIEATLNSLYFRDHAIELELWLEGKHKTGFSSLYSYFEAHPKISGLGTNVSGLAAIKAEYATLSKAVHGSNTKFWMTDSASSVLLWSDSKPKLSQWETRERKVLEGLACLTVCIFSEKLAGTSLPQVRSMLQYLISDSKRTALKSSVGVSI